MTDIVDPATRSQMMGGIRGKNTQPEMRVRSYLHRIGLRYRIHVATLPGCPDLVFPKYQTVVQVQGCFWHRHRGCRFAYTPSSNRGFWARKFSENVARDQRNGLQLRRLGWRVLTVWECELTDTRLHRLARSIRSGAR